METVGAFEAKTHLAALLDRVAKGESITITRRGVEIAHLVPAQASGRRAREEALERLRTFGKGRRLDGISIRELIEEGRRF